jgi:hypothetical protein
MTHKDGSVNSNLIEQVRHDGKNVIYLDSEEEELNEEQNKDIMEGENSDEKKETLFGGKLAMFNLKPK